MLSKTIKRLRAKPEPTRRLIALTISLGFTAIVFVMWGVSFIPYASGELNKASLRDAFPQLDKAANNSAQNAVEENSDSNSRQSGALINSDSSNGTVGQYSDGTSAFIGSPLEPVYDDYNAGGPSDSSNSANSANSDGQSANAQATTTNKALIQ